MEKVEAQQQQEEEKFQIHAGTGRAGQPTADPLPPYLQEEGNQQQHPDKTGASGGNDASNTATAGHAHHRGDGSITDKELSSTSKQKGHSNSAPSPSPGPHPLQWLELATGKPVQSTASGHTAPARSPNVRSAHVPADCQVRSQKPHAPSGKSRAKRAASSSTGPGPAAPPSRGMPLMTMPPSKKPTLRGRGTFTYSTAPAPSASVDFMVGGDQNSPLVLLSSSDDDCVPKAGRERGRLSDEEVLRGALLSLRCGPDASGTGESAGQPGRSERPAPAQLAAPCDQDPPQRHQSPQDAQPSQAKGSASAQECIVPLSNKAGSAAPATKGKSSNQSAEYIRLAALVYRT